MPMGRRIPGGPPRSFLVWFLNFRDRDRVLSEARKLGIPSHCGQWRGFLSITGLLHFPLKTQQYLKETPTHLQRTATPRGLEATLSGLSVDTANLFVRLIDRLSCFTVLRTNC